MGYYKEPEKTAQDFDEDGWFHSGDVGRWNDSGTLTIIDRKKNIFKLAQGEYVAAEQLEGLYSANRFTSQFWIYGNSEESYLVAIAVVNHDSIRTLSDAADIEEICANPEVNAAVLREVNQIATEKSRQGFERIKRIHLCHEEWTTLNDLATPSMKLKRPQLKDHFQGEIDRMYDEIRAEVAPHQKKPKPKKVEGGGEKKKAETSTTLEAQPVKRKKSGRRLDEQDETPKKRKVKKEDE